MKARGTLFGLESRGKFADVSVASITRGLQVIKKKKDPVNPNSTAQKAQRKIYREGKEYYRSLRLTERDRISISRRARLAGINLNPFQMFQKIYFEARILFPFMPFCSQVVTYSPSKGEIYFYCEAQTGLPMFVGVNRKFNVSFNFYAMPEIPGTGKYEVNVAGLLAREKYYFLFIYLDAFGNLRPCSGVYFQWT